jgi:pyrroline-5-carboxylate reductase
MINKNSQILFFGCGKMGSAILQNFLHKKINPKNISIIDPFISNKILDINYFSNISKIHSNFKADLVIFAFKPQMANAALTEIIKYDIFHQNTIFVSILAGKKIAFFENFLKKESKIIRLMPNLPMSIGQGVSAYIANNNLSKNEINFVMDLWSDNISLKSENDIDIFTAIAGSGPAYLFLFAKELINIAKKYDISYQDARKMTVQMLYGSSKMLLDDNLDINDLITSVTSKGGTTEAGLKEFENGEFANLLQKVVDAAKNRSKELG